MQACFQQVQTTYVPKNGAASDENATSTHEEKKRTLEFKNGMNVVGAYRL